MNLRNFAAKAIARNASDIHIHPNRPPALRIDGKIGPIEENHPPLTEGETENILFEVLEVAQRQQLTRDLELDCLLVVERENAPPIRLRAIIQRQFRGWSGVMRVIAEKIPTPEAIGLEPALQRLIELPRGLVLITGPTGSGKSTTLACLVELINQQQQRHILTIEDPIEFVYQPKQSEVTQRQLHLHTHGFAPALRAALRSDPDVILVGEMRDRETIQLALTASETGHLIFSTLHTTDAAQTVDRIIDVMPPAQQSTVRSQLAGVIQAVVSQSLLPHASGSGRLAAREILLATPAIRSLIRSEKTNQISNVLSSGAAEGMSTLEASLAEHVLAGRIRRNDALAIANHPATLLSHLEKS